MPRNELNIESFLRGDFDPLTDLLHQSALARWYGAEQLARSSARRTFVLPDPTR